MSDHELEKLLGGFAADTLTPEEKQALYTAALQDQHLFNALVDEQVLRETLGNPEVRLKLLASLKQPRPSDSGSPLSWVEWFRRPAGLALAGGLSAAALAVVLSVRIYQDSLRQAAQLIATEDSKPGPLSAPNPPSTQPTTPQIIEPQAKAKENIGPAIELQKKDTSIDKPALQKRPASPSSKNDQVSDVAQDGLTPRSRQDEVLSQTEAPTAALNRSAEEATPLSDQKLAASAPPPSTVPEPKRRETPADGRVDTTVAPALSARALYYSGERGLAGPRSMAKEQEQAMKPSAESAPQSYRFERKQEGMLPPDKSAGTAAQLRPLGLRYSFVIHGPDGQEREVDVVTALRSTQPVFLALEANQDTYLQVWETGGSSMPRLLWPEKVTGQTALRVNARQRQLVPLSMESGSIVLTARLSLASPEPITGKEAGVGDRLSLNQVQESITESNRAGPQERATYVVSPELSPLAQVAVDIILNR
jgi:hypothetical protein